MYFLLALLRTAEEQQEVTSLTSPTCPCLTTAASSSQAPGVGLEGLKLQLQNGEDDESKEPLKDLEEEKRAEVVKQEVVKQEVVKKHEVVTKVMEVVKEQEEVVAKKQEVVYKQKELAKEKEAVKESKVLKEDEAETEECSENKDEAYFNKKSFARK